jgi:putative ABC transport system permease protein
MLNAFRQFRRQPLYALTVAGTLALAVAASTASFSVVKRAFLDPLPYRDPDALVSVLTVINGQTWAVSAPVLEDLRGAGSPIAEFAPIDPEGVTFSDGRTTEQISGAYITPDFFSTLGVRPAIGRVWQDGDRDVAVVSWDFWQQSLGGADAAVGRQVSINSVPHTIVGVMPQGFLAPYFTTTAAWMPLDVAPLMAGSGRARRSLSVIARLAPGATVEEANAHLAVFSAQLQRQHPQVHGQQSWIAAPLRDELVGTARPVLAGTGAAAALLLLIVFANVAGLSAARAVGMRQQFAVRMALGATPGRLFRERLREGLVLALAGSFAGIWLGDLIITVVASYQQQFMPRLAPVALDWTTAWFGVVVGLAAGVGAAAVPAGGARSAASLESLRASRGAAGGSGITALRSALVGTQVALALVLLIGAGLLVRTVYHLSTTALGFDSEGLTTFTVTMPVPKYATEERQVQFEREVLERIGSLPAVQASSASVGVPLMVSTRASLSIFGRSDEAGRGEIAYMSMAPDFRAFAGMRLIAGRDLLPTDTNDSAPVVVINETMARQYWPQGDALGAKTRIGPGTTGPWIEVIGIVADVRQHGPVNPVMATAFGSTYQYSWPRRHFSVRSTVGPGALAGDLRATVRAIDPDVAIGAFQTVNDALETQTARHRLVMLSLGFFGAVATVLCGFGLYAVVALTSQMRRREYAIRMALGAPRGGVRWMVVRQALALAIAGAAVGLLIAAVGTRTLEALLHGIRPLDGWTFAAAAVAVLLLAGFAAWIPAVSAGRVDPLEALKAE